MRARAARRARARRAAAAIGAGRAPRTSAARAQPSPTRAPRRAAGARRAAARSSSASSNRSQTSSTNSDRARGSAVVVGRVPAEHQQLLGARDGGVEQVALGRERVLVLAAAPDPRLPRGRGAPPRRAAAGGLAEPGNTPSCSPHTNSTRTRRARSASGSTHGDPRRACGRSPPTNSSRSSASASSRRAAGASSGADARQLAQLLERAPSGGERARLVELVGLEHARAGAARRAEQPLRARAAARSISARGAAPRPPRAGGRSRSSGQCSASHSARARARSSSARAPRALASSAVGELGVLEQPGARSQASRSPLATSAPLAPSARRSAAARAAPGRSRCRRTRTPALQRVGDPGVREHLFEQLGDRAGRAHARSRSPPAAMPPSSSARDLARDQLELGALAAALEQPHRLAGVDARRVGLEQRALQMVQRLARAAARSSSARAGSARCSSRERGERAGRCAARPANATRPGS